MKKTIYILLLSILSIASYGQTCVATGTTKAGKFGMCSPSLGTKNDSVVVWNGTGEKLLKYIPKSVFLSGLGVVQSVTGTTVNNTDPNNPIVNVPTMQQTATAGNIISSPVFFGDLDSGDYTVIAGTDLQMYDSTSPNYIEQNPIIGFKTGSDVSENSLNPSGLDLNGNAATGQKITFKNTAQTTSGVSYDVIDRVAGTYHVAATEDLTGIGDASGDGITITSGVIDVTNLTAHTVTSDGTITANTSQVGGTGKVFLSGGVVGMESGIYADIGDIKRIATYDMGSDTFEYANGQLSVSGTGATFGGNITATNIDATNKTDIAGKQPLDSDLTAIAALSTDAFGRGLLIQTSAANIRSYIGAGTGNGTVTSVTGANGVTVATGTSTPVIGLGNITPTSETISGTAGSGFVAFVPQSAIPATPASGVKAFADSAGAFSLIGVNGFYRKLSFAGLTQDTSVSFPNVASGTVVYNDNTASITNKNLNSGTNTFPTFNQNTTGSAATLTTPRTIGTITGDATSAGSSFDGSANNTNALILATVNSNVGTFGSATQVGAFTVNAKGLTTAASNVTITPAVGSITGLGTGIATFLATPTSANLATALTDETGSAGAVVFSNTPTITTPIIAAINGSAAANGSITLQGTTSGTRTTSYLNLQPNGGNVGIGLATPLAAFHLSNATRATLAFDCQGLTNTPFTDTGTLGAWISNKTAYVFNQGSATGGGLALQGFTSSASVNALIIDGNIGSTSPTATSVMIRGWKSDGSTGRTAMAGTEKIFGVAAGTGSNIVEVLANGNTGINATAPSSTLQVGGSFATGYVAKTATYTATASDYTIDCTSGTFTLTLPTAVGVQGRIYVIKNSGTGTITLATTSSQTIDGVTTKTMNTQYGTFTVQSDNANWKIISQF